MRKIRQSIGDKGFAENRSLPYNKRNRNTEVTLA